MKTRVGNILSRLNVERADIAFLHDSQRVSYRIGDIREAAAVIKELHSQLCAVHNASGQALTTAIKEV